MSISYKRVLLKLSGEALAAGGDDILNFDFITEIANVLKLCVADGYFSFVTNNSKKTYDSNCHQ